MIHTKMKKGEVRYFENFRQMEKYSSDTDSQKESYKVEIVNVFKVTKQ